MSLEKALGYLEKAGYREHVIQLGESTATVAMAAEALESRARKDSQDNVFSSGRQGSIDNHRRNCEDR